MWLQLDRYHFSRDVGGTFTLNFELSSRPIAIGDLVFRKRWWQLLDRLQRKQAREIQRGIVAPLSEALGLVERIFWFGSAPWEWDVWARYGTVDDVRTWAAFLEASLSTTTSRFLTKARAKAK